MLNIDSNKNEKNERDEYLNLDADLLQSRGSLATAREITQQPGVWRDAHAAVDSDRAKIDAWLSPKLSLPGLRVYCCGAGTSAYIGDSIAAWLQGRFMPDRSIRFEAISTTDLVAAPNQYLSADLPTIMISFARSGDSPESIACVELASASLSQCYHLILTCNPVGKLAKFATADSQALCILMPNGTNDRGLAMTSSYSSMLVSCAAIFTPDRAQLEEAALYAERVLTEVVPAIETLVSEPFDRLVVLGAGTLAGTAKEAALKCLELTAGKVVALSDTPLAFRHGPKIIISPSTVVIHLRSNDPQISKYDQDLIDEIRGDNLAGHIIELSIERLFGEVRSDGHQSISSPDDIWLSLVYIVYCQILAFLKSYALGITVDSPCPSGEVSRVVKGVTIHDYSGPGI